MSVEHKNYVASCGLFFLGKGDQSIWREEVVFNLQGKGNSLSLAPELPV